MIFSTHVKLTTVGLFGLAITPVLAQESATTDPQVAQADPQEVEEVVVTGSYIKRAPEDAPSPIQVIGKEELEAKGRPQLGDLVQTLPSVVGSENVTAQDQSVGGAGAANVNIRNLGLSSTLILLDGKRLNAGVSISNQGEQFVDINRLPFIMIDNVEILKDGASAIYGSDAVAGVANFRLRNDFEGFEIQAFYQDPFKDREVNFDEVGLPEIFRDVIDAHSEDEHSDLDIGAIWGFGNDKTQFVIGFNYFEREPLETVDREFAIQRVTDGSVGGPSPFNFPQDMFGSIIIPGVGEIPGTALINDSSCLALGHYRTRNSGLCSTKLDLLSRDIFSKERRKQALATWSHDINDQVQAYGHFGFSENKVTLSQSPSFPITAQAPFSPANPGFIFEVQNAFQALATTGTVPNGDDFANRLVPAPLPVVPLIPNAFDPTDPAAVLASIGTITFNGVMRPSLAHLAHALGVPADVNGDGVVEDGEIFTHRNQSRISRDTRVFMAGLQGDFMDDWNYDVSYNYSQEEGETIFFDTVISRFRDAINGYFGVNCDRNTPGQLPGEGPCTWFNPFGSALLFPDTVVLDGNGNPHTLGNDAAAIHALEAMGQTEARTTLQVLNAVVSTNNLFGWELQGGSVGFAAGLQYREEEFRVGGNDLTTDQSFPFAFTGPTIPFEASQDIFAVFGELALPILDNLEAQFAIRYEDYGDQTGNTVDPKLALRWQPMDDLVLRGSVGTSFRGPSLNQKFGRATGLQFISPPPADVVDANFGAGAADTSPFGSGVFARLPTFGNDQLQPEESVNFNLGVIWTPIDNLSISLDYWSYDYDNIIIQDDFRALTNDCQVAWGLAGRPVAQLADGSFNPDYLALAPCNFRDFDQDGSTPDIFLDTQGNPLSVETSYTNGTDLKTSGLDLLTRYTYPSDYGVFGATLDLAWFAKYEIKRAITPFDTRLVQGEVVDLVGRSENVLVGRPLPEYKATFLADWAYEQHYATIVLNYVSEITEPNSFPPNLRVSSHSTVDASYTYSFKDFGLSLTAGAVNLFDKAPPTASGFNAFESTIHDPRGRLWYFRARYTF